MGFRKSFSLIEILFAIVIISTILTPIPALLGSIEKMAQETFYKNAMFIALKKMMHISSYPWDDKVFDNIDSIMKILDTNSSYFIRKSQSSIARKYGEYRVYDYDPKYATYPIPTIHTDNNLSSVDSFNNTSDNTSNNDFNIIYNIYYIDDSIFDKNGSKITILLNNTKEQNVSSNIKIIQATGKQNILNNPYEFKFKYFLTNIGEVDLKGKYIPN